VARVPYLHRAEAGEQSQPLYDRLEAERPTPTAHIFLALANAPEQLDAFLTYANTLRRCELGPRLRELLVLTVGYATGCDYEVAHHQPHALAAGLTPEQVKAMPDFETAEVFDDFDKAVMRLARAVASRSDVSTEMWNAVADHLTTQQMVQLMMTLSWYISGALMMAAFELELEEGYSMP
jgi:AhpD family alkylhydroperoxidase